MTIDRTRGWGRREARRRRLADSIKDNRPSPVRWILWSAWILVVSFVAVFWMLRGGR